MKRIHENLREAGEVVFVDATGCVDQLNTAVIPLLCSGPVGALPLAVLFTSSLDEATLTKAQLVVFMVEIFDVYMRQRLVNVALGRRRVKNNNIGTVSMQSITSLGVKKFIVKSQTNPDESYDIDLSIGMCTCPKGEYAPRHLLCPPLMPSCVIGMALCAFSAAPAPSDALLRLHRPDAHSARFLRPLTPYCGLMRILRGLCNL
ncbi:hypothetical protein GWK47_026625 [Chionoecetes opilio]|uniref:SWIM-type domain-containing protein n=1 Tax=Chionoecetes opilio TaxID=41210 RepID=A0A8J8WCA2_CHIOP|nr:hypothetical protein GWK47_026625 [Chionoecetes opilio]